MSSSPLTSLSRTPAQLASLVGTILMPYFLSKPSTEAITTLAQSVSGMKPILTSSFSGLSEPCAQACRDGVVAAAAPNAAADAACSKRRRDRSVARLGGVEGTMARCMLRTLVLRSAGPKTTRRPRPCACSAARPSDAFVLNLDGSKSRSTRLAVEPQPMDSQGPCQPSCSRKCVI